MNLNKILIKDSDGKPSVTMTAFVTGFIVVNLKLLASGLTIAGYDMSPFTGVDYSAAIGALGAIYVMRRSGDNTEMEKIQEDTDKRIKREKPGVSAPRKRKSIPKAKTKARKVTVKKSSKSMWDDIDER